MRNHIQARKRNEKMAKAMTEIHNQKNANSVHRSVEHRSASLRFGVD